VQTFSWNFSKSVMGIREQIGDEPSFLSSLSLIVASVVMFSSREIPPS
jgi:hypothetical protein